VFESRVDRVSYRPDGRAIAVVCKSENLSLWLLGPEPLALLRTRIFRVSGYWYYPVAFEPGGRWLVAGSGEGQRGALRVWDATAGQPLDRRIELGERFAAWLSYSPDGRLLQATEPGGIVRLWDAATDRPLAIPFLRIPGDLRTSFHPSGRALLAAP